MLETDDIKAAAERIKSHVITTPILESSKETFEKFDFLKNRIFQFSYCFKDFVDKAINGLLQA